jgi:osmotically-inducible protein OsmY
MMALKINKLSKILGLLVLSIGLNQGLSGCTPIGLAATAGATAGSLALEERSLKDSLNDRAIMLSINKALADKNMNLFSNISVDVLEGAVLLSGIVPKAEHRLEAVRIAWQEEDVHRVINEILIGKTIGFEELSHDTLVKTKLKTALTFDGDVKAVNYQISVIGGKLYLFGLAQNRAEVERVKDHARETPYVRQIIDHMVLKDDPERLKRIGVSQ